MQPRGFQAPGNGLLDFGRFPLGGQGRPIGYPQGSQTSSFMEDGYGGMDEDSWQQKGSLISQGGNAGNAGVQSSSPPPYGYLGSQAQHAFNGGFPSAKAPPTFPPPQPGAALSTSITAGTAEASFGFQSKDSVVSSAPIAGRLAQPDLSRVLHTQPPPPPSQAPLVPPGPPPSAPPLMSPSSPQVNGEGSAKDAEHDAKERYGLLGILKVIRMTDPDLNTLALGMDLTTLGLNLNSPECLYSTFASPWSETPSRKDPDYLLPPCYYMNPPQLKQAHLQKFSLETLFYIFFNMPRDTLQAYAAAELYNRGWLYHRELKKWFILQEEEGQPRWVCFDLTAWEKQYYMHTVDAQSFLTEDDVRVKMPSAQGELHT